MRKLFILISMIALVICCGITNVSAQYDYSEQYPSINVLEEYYIRLGDGQPLNNTPAIIFYVDPQFVHQEKDSYEMTIYSLFLPTKQVRKEHFTYHLNNDTYTDYSMVQYKSANKELIRTYSTKDTIGSKTLLTSSLTKSALKVYRHIYE